MEEISTNPLVEKLNKEREVSYNFQQRRHEQWNDNYELYRNKIKTNRLTQRQAVNIPLMKETIRTILSRIDDVPDIEFKENSGNEDKELLLNELWKYDYDRLNFEGIDIQDKKTVLLYGRGFKKLNFLDGKFDVDALDIYDILIDPKVNPLDIETARWIIHQNIFKTAKDILASDKYTAEGKRELKAYLTTDEGIVQSEQNRKILDEKQDRLESLGVKNFDEFAAGEEIVNISEHYTYLWNDKKKEFERYVIVLANQKIVLLKEKLKDVIGVDFYPFVSWGDDIDTQDFWTDGVADIVRVPNKVLNIWFSQMLENRTMRNFGMTWFDSTIPNYTPPTMTPSPGKLLPAPGDPNKVLKQVDIPDLTESLPEMQFLIQLIERATAATAIEKGVKQQGQITLGEVQLLANKAAERIISIAKFYRRAWKEFAEKWYKILEANVADNDITRLYKIGGDGKLWEKEVKGSDWKSKAGYTIKVSSSSEQEEEKMKGLQRLMLVRQQFPDNPELQKITEKRMLEITNLSPDEIKSVIDAEQQKQEQPQLEQTANPEAQSLLQELQSLKATNTQ